MTTLQGNDYVRVVDPKSEYFGKTGTIQKIVDNVAHVYVDGSHGQTVAFNPATDLALINRN